MAYSRLKLHDLAINDIAVAAERYDAAISLLEPERWRA
jgi:hypothetical protein